MNLQILLLLLLIFFSLVELNSSATKSNNPPNVKDFLQHKGEHNSLQNEEKVNNKVSNDKNEAYKYHYYMKKGAVGGHGGGGGGSGVGRGVGGGGSNAIHHPPYSKKSNGASLEVHPLTSIILTISSMLYIACGLLFS